MLTFKQFIIEAKLTHGVGGVPIMVNPRTPAQVFDKINSDERGATKRAEGSPVYKFWFDVSKDKLYVWWFGDSTHTQIRTDFGIKANFGGKSTTEENNAIFGYMNVSTRKLEILFNNNFDDSDVDEIIGFANSKKNFQPFKNKFKIFKTIGFSKSKFKKFL
jgi:hypothetical protein